MQDRISICRTAANIVGILFSLVRFSGHLSDRPFAGQNENLPVLSRSPALFVKTALRLKKDILAKGCESQSGSGLPQFTFLKPHLTPTGCLKKRGPFLNLI